MAAITDGDRLDLLDDEAAPLIATRTRRRQPSRELELIDPAARVADEERDRLTRESGDGDPRLVDGDAHRVSAPRAFNFRTMHGDPSLAHRGQGTPWST